MLGYVVTSPTSLPSPSSRYASPIFFNATATQWPAPHHATPPLTDCPDTPRPPAILPRVSTSPTVRDAVEVSADLHALIAIGLRAMLRALRLEGRTAEESVGIIASVLLRLRAGDAEAAPVSVPLND